MSTAWKPPIRNWLGVSTETIHVPVADIVTYMVVITGTATFDVDYTLEPLVQGNLTTDSTTILTFSDNNPSDDTVTRNKGSWIADRFVPGMLVTIAGTTTNDGTFLIDSVTEDTLTFDSAVTITNQTITDSSGVTMEANLSDDFWKTDHQVVSTSEFVSREWGPTGIRFSRASGTGTADIWVKS